MPTTYRRPKQILIIQSTPLCHVSLALPLIYAVAQSYPQQQFSYLLTPQAAELVLSPPDNLEVITKNPNSRWLKIRSSWQIKRLIKKHHYDQIIDLERTRLSRYLTFAATFARKARKTTIKPLKISEPKRKKLFRKRKVAYSLADSLYKLMKDCFERANLAPLREVAPIQISPLHAYIERGIDKLPHVDTLIGFAPFGSNPTPMEQEVDYAHQIATQLLESHKQLGIVFFTHRQATKHLSIQDRDRIAVLDAFDDYPKGLATIGSLSLFIGTDSVLLFLARMVGTEVMLIKSLYKATAQTIATHTKEILETLYNK